MRSQRTLALVVAIVATLFLGNILNFTVTTNRFNESYPAVVCPPNKNGLSTAISLSAPKTLIRKTGTSSMKFSEVRLKRYAIAAQSAVIDSGKITPVVWQIRKGVWAGAIACSAPATSQWFVGAAADITSKGSLHVVNSGLGRALVEITIFTENGELAPRTISIRPNSYSSLALASLAPGSKKIAIHLLPRAGRINGFLVDERGKGLTSLGGDLINPTLEATTRLQIPAIPQQVGRSGGTPHTLRLLVPGDVDARISAEIRSTDGTFSPVGITDRRISHKRVVELPMDITMEAGKFALHIVSDQPILGSVFSPTNVRGKRDFVWSTAANDLTEFTMATTGLAPLLIFTGREVRVTLEMSYSNGRVKKIAVDQEDIATVKVPASVQSVSFKQISKGTSGAALIASTSGYGYLPLQPGGELTRSSVPSSDIRVLNP